MCDWRKRTEETMARKRAEEAQEEDEEEESNKNALSRVKVLIIETFVFLGCCAALCWLPTFRDNMSVFKVGLLDP
jgi:hypothetical protein